MLRRFIFALLVLIVPQLVVAQSMTDDKVIQFVLEQQEKGKSQQEIVSQLLKKGVTAEQLRRVRKKYEAQSEQLGAVDLTGKDANKSQTRLRDERQMRNLDAQRKNSFIVKSQYEEKNLGTRKERLDALNEEISFLDIDSLVYYQNLLRDENEVFGRNIFNNRLLTFEPNMNMATPPPSQVSYPMQTTQPSRTSVLKIPSSAAAVSPVVS